MNATAFELFELPPVAQAVAVEDWNESLGPRLLAMTPTPTRLLVKVPIATYALLAASTAIIPASSLVAAPRYVRYRSWLPVGFSLPT